MIDPGLEDKVVLVTGANNPHGVGAAVARAFAEQGAAVFLTYLRAANYPADSTEEGPTPGRPFYARQQIASIEPVLDSIRHPALSGDSKTGNGHDINVPSLRCGGRLP